MKVVLYFKAFCIHKEFKLKTFENTWHTQDEIILNEDFVTISITMTHYSVKIILIIIATNFHKPQIK